MRVQMEVVGPREEEVLKGGYHSSSVSYSSWFLFSFSSHACSQSLYI